MLKRKDRAEKLSLLKGVLLQGPELASSLCEIGLAKDMISLAVANVFMAYGVAPQLMKWMITQEVQKTSQPSTLFRVNSLSTRMMGVLYKKYGKDYLRQCMATTLSAVCAKDFVMPLTGNINNLTAPEGNDVSLYVSKLTSLTQELINRICASKDTLSMNIRQILHHLYIEVEKKAPAHKTLVIGSFIFLRWICPVVLSPDAFGFLSEKLGDQGQRALLMISTILQKLANGVEFSDREETNNEHLAAINKLILKNIPTVMLFLDQVAAVTIERKKLFYFYRELR